MSMQKADIPESILQLAEKNGQLQVFRFWNELNELSRADLVKQFESIDFDMIKEAMEQTNLASGSLISPLKTMTLAQQEERKAAFQTEGNHLIREGKVAALVLAGGQGSRLGFNGPKGTLNVGITRELYLFEILLNNMLANIRAAAAETNQEMKYLHFCVMTSDQNHEQTVSFFEDHHFFGYPEKYIHFFKQDQAPALSHSGEILLDEKDRISLAPNGNGGWFRSMMRCGLWDLLKKDGVEWINVVSVDNVLQNIADPVFLGAASLAGVPAAAKVIAKVSPDERVGAICYRNGRPSVVEYSELTDEMRLATDEKGQYLYHFGVTLNYLFKMTETEKAAGTSLPIHKANKKIKCLTEAGEPFVPEEPNAYKLEYFIFDILEAFDEVLSMECLREDEFAPIKNKAGVDSLQTARDLLVKKTGITL
ncbi:MAG: UTP--glucose-1-phosphate uridylyltransferase [Firmicutes bacterium]|nr:UTP--glucose-1-phosphate uridylyltransferase [Bacillota bacterium]